MEKRLSRSDYLFTLIFIFMLALSVFTFFYGVQIGKEKAAAQYERLMKKDEEQVQQLTAYHQQYLVSFYHTIYLPFRDFEKKWFEHTSAIDLVKNGDSNHSGMLKELSKLAERKFSEVSSVSMPATSPLLKEAQQEYMKSLKLFSDSLANHAAKSDKMEGKTVLRELSQDAYVQEAKNFALHAQNKYFSAIVKWHLSVDENLQDLKLDEKDAITFKDWDALSLTVKNSLIAQMMQRGGYFQPYLPQDLSVRVDELIESGIAVNMKLSSVDSIVGVLVQTEAVRAGDFNRSKQKYYSNETLPQLPFFFEQR